MNLFTRPALSYVILAVGLAASMALFAITRNSIHTEARLKFERRSSDAHHSIEARVRSYTDIMYGMRALFGTSERINSGQFNSYVKGLDLGRRFPGFLTLNYAEHVREADRTGFESRVRNDRSLNGLGFPAFSIKPAGSRPYYHVVTYIEPFAGNEGSFGRDVLGGDAARTAAFERQIAASTDMSSSGRPVQIEGKDGRFWVIAMRLPVFRSGAPLDAPDQRLGALLGTLGAGFRMREVMENVLDAPTLQTLRFRVYDAGPARAPSTPPAGQEPQRVMLFDSLEFTGETILGEPARDETLSTVLAMTVAGRSWQVEFSAPRSAMIGDAARALPWIALGGGMLVSLLLFGIAFSLTSSRSRAIKLAAEITRDLRDSEASLAESQRMAHLGNWSLQVADGRMTWSAEMCRILGTDPAGHAPSFESFASRVHEEDRKAFEEALNDSIANGALRELEHRVVQGGNAVRWVHSMIRPAFEGERRIVHGTIRDITDRQLVALRLRAEHRITQLVASANDVGEFMPGAIAAICNAMGWECGFHWMPSAEGSTLACGSTWQRGVSQLWELKAGTQRLRVPSGVDLPGRAWARRSPVFVAELGGEAGLSRRELAAAAGLVGAAAIPVMTASQFCGVMEFYSRRPIVADEELKQLAGSFAEQVAQFFQRKHAEESLRYIATHDALTELPNRSMFNDRLVHAIHQAERYRRGLAVLFVDIDRFKMFNDTLGHSAGDRVLAGCARRLEECLRESDVVARLGGDEFVVMVENFSEPREAVAIAQKIHAALARPFFAEGQELLLTASIGIATFPDDGADAEALLKNADIAMYRAKEQGRNNYQFYSAQMNKHSFERLAMESSLRRAVERDEFLLHYQPKVNLATGQVTGVEALVRWKHPDWGMIPPGQFISLAEETGIIVQIGGLVLEKACEQARRWHEEGLTGLRVAVNLSARQFAHKDLLQDIARIVARTALPPGCLELEITESLVMDNPELAAQTLGKLKAMGVLLSIDDFGTGYSSLAYLKRFPIDAVKIDRSFIKDIPADADDMAITQGVIALAHSLRLKAIAEGVETEEQREFLRAKGCDEMQGYLFSKPLPAEEVAPLLRSQRERPHLQVVETLKRARS